MKIKRFHKRPESSLLLNLFDELDKQKKNGTKFLVTISFGTGKGTDSVASFGEDNWIYFKRFINETDREGFYCGIIVRRFEKLKDSETGIPLKSICGIFYGNGMLVPFAAEETAKAFSYDHETGEPIPKENMVNYVSASKMFPGFFDKNLYKLDGGTTHER